jgi:uncharacterized membrane protein YuzA (DUF378 family)
LIKIINAITLAIIIFGGINLAIVGLFDFDVIKTLWGEGSAETDPGSATAHAAYILIGLAAAWQIGVLLRSLTPKGG